MSIALRYDDAAIERLADRIRAFADQDRSGLMEAIAFEGENQTRRRITVEKTAPDGTRWPAWSPAYAASRHRGHGLLERSGALVDSIVSDSSDEHAEWGSNLIYFAIHNFGGTEDMAPGPAGIPQRQSLGLSSDNETDIQAIVDDWAERQLEEL